MIVESMISAALGSIFGIWLQKKTGWNSKQMIIYHICVIMILPFYSILGLIEGITFGLKQKWEMYLFVFVFTVNMGSVQSFSRSTMAVLIPHGYESKMFSLYEITDKGSSWIGPLILSVMTNYVNLRIGVFYVVIFFVISLPILLSINLKKGVRDALNSHNIKADSDESNHQNDSMKIYNETNNYYNETINVIKRIQNYVNTGTLKFYKLKDKINENDGDIDTDNSLKPVNMEEPIPSDTEHITNNYQD